MSNTLLGVTASTTPRLVEYRGLHAYCTGYADDRDGTVYASIIGRVTAVTGIWAAFQSGSSVWIDGGGILSKRPKLEGATYHTLRTRLPKSDWLHLVLLHSQATMRNLPDQAFFILNATPDPPLEAFWAQWNNALPFPALPSWKTFLWEQGIAQGVICTCNAEGTHCWEVWPLTDEWSEILQKSVKEVKTCHV